jgi:hypothetical protein
MNPWKLQHRRLQEVQRGQRNAQDDAPKQDTRVEMQGEEPEKRRLEVREGHSRKSSMLILLKILMFLHKDRRI